MATRLQRSPKKGKPHRECHLPRNAAPLTVTISHIGGRGDGVGIARYTNNNNESEHTIFVPASLPGETIIAQPISISKQGIKARMIELSVAAPSRQTPQCNAFPVCGGCSLQHWTSAQITAWKRQLISAHLERLKVSVGSIRPMLTSPAKSRRRASFHVKRFTDSIIVGFHERMSSHIVDPDGCTILDPKLVSLKTALGTIAKASFPIGASVKAQANLPANHDPTSLSGLCLYLQNTGPKTLWTPTLLNTLCTWAAGQKLSRLSIDEYGTPLTIYAPAQPQIKYDKISVTPPPGAFLQATKHGEESLQNAVAEILDGHTQIADLFSGCGALSLPLIEQLSKVLAVEIDSASLTALKAGVEATGYGGHLVTLQRNLFDLPLLPSELAKATAVIIDPPRGGAIAQCKQIAKSHIKTVAIASCNPASFARDAACLTAAGFELHWVQPVDQFTQSNHVELIAAFFR